MDDGARPGCPNGGMRASELAAGCLEEVFDELWNSQEAVLLQRAAELEVSEEDVSLVMKDFEGARSFAQLGLLV
eukprot:1880670-Lingulodinium_polyedra.AAC.1